MIHLGDIVKLKRPYKPLLDLDAITPIDRVQAWDTWTGFTYGIVVQVKNNWKGELTRVRLHLYEPSLSFIYMGPNYIPTYVDFSVMEIELHKPASELNYKTLPKLTAKYQPN